MRSVKKNSIPAVKRVMKNTDLYSVTKLPIHAALKDGGAPSSASLQTKWLYDSNGLYNKLVNFSSFILRLTEFNTVGDYLNSLRQRISIVHEMIRCDFTSRLPVHFSAIPINSSITTLDLNDADSCNNFTFIAHPGQTRIQASIFSGKELGNVLVYIPKKYKVDVVLTEDIIKIKSIEKLLSIFDPIYNLQVELNEQEPEIEYDFMLPGFESGLKSHFNRKDDPIEILKVSQMQDKTYLHSDLHSSRFYLQKTFTHTNRFFDILFRNKLNVYTTNIDASKQHQRSKNIDDIKLLINCDKKDQGRLSHYISMFGHLHPADNMFNGTEGGIQGLISYSRVANSIPGELTKDEINTLTEFNIKKEDKYTYPSLYYKEVDIDCNLEDIVRKNEYKGICILHKTKNSSFIHDYNYLLFHLPFEYTLTRSKDKSIWIINCEHPYWKTGDSYLENVL
jgi:hypothetical protein